MNVFRLYDIFSVLFTNRVSWNLVNKQENQREKGQKNVCTYTKSTKKYPETPRDRISQYVYVKFIFITVKKNALTLSRNIVCIVRSTVFSASQQ